MVGNRCELPLIFPTIFAVRNMPVEADGYIGVECQGWGNYSSLCVMPPYLWLLQGKQL